MLARIQSYLLSGIDAAPCEVEVDVDRSAEAKATVVGLPDAGVKEALERVRAALTNAGFIFPNARVLINLAPADVRKEGPMYDLPIALGLLAAQGVLAGDGLRTGEYLMAGELALDGRVRPIKGAIALASLARAKGARGVIVPAENAEEAALVPGVEAIGVRTITELIGLIAGQIEPSPHAAPDVASLLATAEAPVDFREVRGQEGVKRAMVVAAAGSHNLLGIGPCVRLGRGRRGGVRLRAVGHNAAALWAGGGDGARRCSLTDGLPLDG